MNRIELARQSVERHLNDIRDLLAMRLLFPPEHTVIAIEKEIRDLYTYPERLETSHRDEWKAIAVKALHRNAFRENGQTDEKNLEDYLGLLQEYAIDQCKTDNAELFRCLEQLLAIEQAANTITFHDAKRREVLRLIWPDHK